MRKSRGWIMPTEDARAMIQQIEERMRASDIEVRHRDALIRLCAILEDDLAESGRAAQGASSHPDRHHDFRNASV